MMGKYRNESLCFPCLSVSGGKKSPQPYLSLITPVQHLCNSKNNRCNIISPACTLYKWCWDAFGASVGGGCHPQLCGGFQKSSNSSSWVGWGCLGPTVTHCLGCRRIPHWSHLGSPQGTVSIWGPRFGIFSMRCSSSYWTPPILCLSFPSPGAALGRVWGSQGCWTEADLGRNQGDPRLLTHGWLWEGIRGAGNCTGMGLILGWAHPWVLGLCPAHTPGCWGSASRQLGLLPCSHGNAAGCGAWRN